MPRYYQRKTTTDTIAIGIEGHVSSLCGAIKRFQRKGKQWNGLLSLKERCARRIALIKHEQIRWFITAYLPPHLFKYVTKDIFNLRGNEFVSNYPKDFELCDTCIEDIDAEPAIKCRCPNVETAMQKLNKYFFKRMNAGKNIQKNDLIFKRMNAGNNMQKDGLKEFELIYKVPYDEDQNWKYEKPLSFFLYLSPSEYQDTTDIADMDDDMNSICYQSYRNINVQASVEDKLLFVDAMRFFGGFRSKHEQPQLTLSSRCEIDR